MPKVIYATPFTGKTPWGDGFRGQPWYEYRYKIWKDNTLKSLVNQTDKDFLWWLQFRAQEKNNPVTKQIEEDLKNSGLQYIMTFYGPIQMEDKAIWHNIDLLERAEKSLKELPEIKDDWVIEVTIDSDDMVHQKFTEHLKSREIKERKAFFMRKGFMVTNEGKLADWKNPESMSLYAIVYPKKFFLDGRLHFYYQRGLDSHEQIPSKFEAEELPEGMFCCVFHKQNISTIWEHPFRGKEYFYSDEIESILKQFKTL